MKKSFLLLALGSGILLGCSDGNIHSAKVREELKSMDANFQPMLEEGLADVDAGKFSAALEPLRKVAFGAKLDKKQREVINDTIAKVRARIAAASSH